MVMLYRPVGLKEAELILESDFETFPPRLPEQPIFYPVLNFEYAKQIACAWNTKFSTFVGYVTEFNIPDSYANQFTEQIVGSSIHKELWVPAEQLPEFNDNISGKIQFVGAYYGARYTGPQPIGQILNGKDTVEQLLTLFHLWRTEPKKFGIELDREWRLVLLNYWFWLEYDFLQKGLSSSDKFTVLSEMAINLKHRKIDLDRLREAAIV